MSHVPSCQERFDNSGGGQGSGTLRGNVAVSDVSETLPRRMSELVSYRLYIVIHMELFWNIFISYG